MSHSTIAWYENCDESFYYYRDRAIKIAMKYSRDYNRLATVLSAYREGRDLRCDELELLADLCNYLLDWGYEVSPILVRAVAICFTGIANTRTMDGRFQSR